MTNTSPSGSSVQRLVLASTSYYRRQLLDRLRIPFIVHAPGIEETPLAGEEALSLAHRLAQAKAVAVAERYPDGVIIGSDQTAVLGNTLLGKPGTVAAAVAQLQAASGAQVLFHTGVHVFDPRRQQHAAHVDTTIVRFRQLSEQEIVRYVEAETPLDCAGAFKAEGLGISLFERIDSQDPTALMGLPLIWLSGALRRAGFDVP